MTTEHFDSSHVKGGTDLLAELERNGELAMLVSAPPIAFNPLFVDITGSVTAALLLSACTQDNEAPSSEDGWVQLSAERWNKLTRLSLNEQRTARRTLSDLKLIEVRRQGFPAKAEFRVNFDRLTSKVLHFAQKKLAERKQADVAVVH
jgi:hypothetical protein